VDRLVHRSARNLRVFCGTVLSCCTLPSALDGCTSHLAVGFAETEGKAPTPKTGHGFLTSDRMIKSLCIGAP
jgi:hypothetical protein